MKIRDILMERYMYPKVPTVEQLTSTMYFHELTRLSPTYANMLQTAWEKDIREYNTTYGKHQRYLFPQLTAEYAEYAPEIKNLPVTRMILDHMLELYYSAFNEH